MTLLALPLRIKNKPLWKNIGPEGQIGFWLPIRAGPFLNERKGKSDLSIWMEYSPATDSFLGALTMGVAYHVEVHHVQHKKNEWHVKDNLADDFLGSMVDGNYPQTFHIGGFRGEWVLTASPFT